MRRPTSVNSPTVILLVLVTVSLVVVQFRATTQQSPQGILQGNLKQNGRARLFLHDDDWNVLMADDNKNNVWQRNKNVHDTSPKVDVSCRRNHKVPDALATKMTKWGQWAAMQPFFTKHSGAVVLDGSQRNVRLLPNEHEAAPQVCHVASWKREEWSLDHFELISDHLPDLRAYSYVMIKKLGEPENDHVWVLTNSTKTALDGEEELGGGPYFIQAYRLSMDGGNEFCEGMMSMTMAMGGFQRSLGKKKGDCLTYFVGPWKLNTAGKFQGAMVYSFLLALMTEGITAFQGWIKKFLSGKLRKVIMPLLYAVQQWLGYITMLITMMYSIELFGCVLLGLIMGRIMFHPRGGPVHRAPSAGRTIPRSSTDGSVPTSQNSESGGLRRRRS